MAKKFQVDRKTISKIWDRYIDEEGSYKRRTYKNGRKKKRESTYLEAIMEIPLDCRRTIRQVAGELCIPKSTIHRDMRRDNEVKRTASSIKPWLEDHHKLARIKFVKSHIKDSGQFDDMMNVIHVDEKWYYTEKVKKNFCMHKKEADLMPKRRCKNKRFIPKLMFAAAVARPRYNSNANKWFTGLICIEPFVVTEPAVRSSKNRPAGTPVVKAINVKQKQHRDMMIQKILPAIFQKWPHSQRNKTIYIQLDNAGPHTPSIDRECEKFAADKGWDIKIRRQPANSPDMNVLDLVRKVSVCLL